MALYTSDDLRILLGNAYEGDQGSLSVTTALDRLNASYKHLFSEDTIQTRTVYDELPVTSDDNADPRSMGRVVESFAHAFLGHPYEQSFQLPAKLTPEQRASVIDQLSEASDQSVILAYKLMEPALSPTPKLIDDTKLLINRSVSFFDSLAEDLVGHNVRVFDPTPSTVNRGIMDFLTASTIWDMKVSRHPYQKKWFYQVLIYYLLLNRTDPDHRIEHLAIFNPLRGKVYMQDISDIDDAILRFFEVEIMGYSDSLYTELSYEEEFDDLWQRNFRSPFPRRQKLIDDDYAHLFADCDEVINML